MALSVHDRWSYKLARRRVLLADARARSAPAALIKLRELQVAQARRVMNRHPGPAVSVSSAGVNLVARFEGFRAYPYQDVNGKWAIGYGDTLGITAHTPPYPRAYAYSRLRERLNRDYLPAVLAAAKAGGVKLRQNQIDALVSLAYNVGTGVVGSKSQIGIDLRHGLVKNVSRDFLLYDRAGGTALPGLLARRKAERDLFDGAAK